MTKIGITAQIRADPLTGHNFDRVGKKSKAKAKASSGGSTKASPSLFSSSTAAVAPALGASIGGNAGVAAFSSKQNKLKCVRCLANIKDKFLFTQKFL